jgi:hypothetical protein
MSNSGFGGGGFDRNNNPFGGSGFGGSFPNPFFPVETLNVLDADFPSLV